MEPMKVLRKVCFYCSDGAALEDTEVATVEQLLVSGKKPARLSAGEPRVDPLGAESMVLGPSQSRQGWPISCDLA